MKKKYRLILQGGTALAFVLIFTAVIFYAKGYFDLTFVRRPERPEEETEQQQQEGEKRNPDNHSGEVNDQYIKNNVSEGDEAHTTYAEMISKIPLVSELKEKNYEKTDESFDRDYYVLARLEIPEVTTAFTHSDELVEKPEKVYDKYGGYKTVMQTVKQAKPAIKLYDGMILYNDDTNGHILFDSDFNEMISDFDTTKYVPAYKFTYSGHLPIFNIDGASFVLLKKEYYPEDEETSAETTEKKEETTEKKAETTARSTTETKAEEKEPEPIVQYILTEIMPDEFPATYPTADIPARYLRGTLNDYELIHDPITDLWGYTDTISNTIEPRFFAAYDFNSNGLAAVVTQEGKYIFIDTNCAVAIDHSGSLRYQNGKMCDYYLIPPDTYGLESLGMFYFDHGLTRVRYRLYDQKDGIKKTYEDYDMLINEKGEKFDLPIGYNLISYSEGVSVLEKDGKYGLYDITQRWLAKPIYDSVSPFIEGVSVICSKNGKYALIDTRGNILLDFVFDYISMPSNGVIAAYEQENGWSVFQIMTMPYTPEDN